MKELISFSSGFYVPLPMLNAIQTYGIRAVVEAINADKPIDKVFIQKGLKGELSKELETVIRKKGINASYVPVENLTV